MKRPVVAIVGVGLMGGSLGLCLRRRKKWRVVGTGSRPSTLRKAKRRGSVDAVTSDLGAAAREASVVVLAAPVHRLAGLARQVRPFLRPDCLVVDVGSVKEPIVRTVSRFFAGPTGPWFVGCHPMAGSEKTGVENARADLYQGAVCVITPGPRTAAAAVRRAEAFWRGVGAKTLRLRPAEHDRQVALVSHLPHLLADALVLAAAAPGRNLRLVKALAAGSFRDATRVADADPAQWRAIFRMNDRSLREAVRLFQKRLARLAAGRWPLAALGRARAFRRKIFA